MKPVGQKDARADLVASSTAYPAKNLSFHVVTVCLCVCCFVSALDTIILSSTLPAIAANLQATTANAYWCSSAFLFAQSVVQLIYAVFAKAFHRRTCMLAALTFFTVASTLCATARDIQWLIAARTVSWTVSSSLFPPPFLPWSPPLRRAPALARPLLTNASFFVIAARRWHRRHERSGPADSDRYRPPCGTAQIHGYHHSLRCCWLGIRRSLRRRYRRKRVMADVSLRRASLPSN